MKRFVIIYILFMVSIFGTSAQNSSLVLQTDKHTYYINNQPNTYFTIRFDSGQFAETKIRDLYLFNQRETYITTQSFDTRQYRVRINSKAELELLNKYISNERKVNKHILKHKVKVDQEQFIVEHRKRFALWTSQMQTKKNKKREYKKYVVGQFGMPSMVDSVSHRINLTFTANGRIVNLSYPVYWNDNLEEEQKRIKQIADGVNVYGFPVHTNALALQQHALNHQYYFRVEEQKAGLTLYLPEWLNICTYASSGLLFTMPEFKNNKGIVNVQWQSADEITFEKYVFNILRSDNVSKYVKMKRPLMERGEFYEVVVNDQWKGIYVFLKGSKSNVWINYTAKPITYDLDIPKFREFIHGVEVY